LRVSDKSEASRAAPVLTVAAIGDLLRPENHLTNALQVAENLAFNRTDSNKEKFTQQIEALRAAGTQRLSANVSNLILYLDYTSDYVRARLKPHLGTNAIIESRAVWPAFDTILKIGDPAIPSVEAFVHDERQEMRYRLAALEVLCVLDQARCQSAARKLSLTPSITSSTNTVRRIRQIECGQHSFSGATQIRQ
jgi:hypothetical protein